MAETPPNPVHAKLVQILGERGPIDAVTLSELAEVPYSTTAAKLRGWADKGEIIRIKGVGKTPNTFKLHDATGSDTALGAQQPADTDGAPDPQQDGNVGDPEPAEPAPPVTDADADASETVAAHAVPTEDAPTPGELDVPVEPTVPKTTDTPVSPEPEPVPTPDGNDDAVPDPAAESQQEAADKPVRRAPGAVRDAALRVLRANPDTEFKVIEVARLIQKDFAAAGDLADVSSGAVVNALNKYCGTGEALRTVDKPATYKAA